ncbi:hypothetical protein H6G64_18170 [Calothrix sp. FACHB-156]|nr:hypothetical protein [Nostoc linckia FACHB-104]MBD2338902.1 hypothetical protein [Calothrix sp. FACHB-156]
MANIKVNDLLRLNLTGTELFNDSESFMKELSEDDYQVFGGGACAECTCARTSGLCYWKTNVVAMGQEE